jgi:hypothetical protein
MYQYCSPSHVVASQPSRIVPSMKYTFTLAVAAVLLDSAIASPVNVEARQGVSSAQTCIPYKHVTNDANSKAAVQAHMVLVPTKQTTPSKATQSTTLPRTPAPKSSPSSSGVTAPAAPTGALTPLSCKTSPATASWPSPRAVLMAVALPTLRP